MALSVESPTYKLWAYTTAANLTAGLVLCLILGAASQDLADGLLTFFVLFCYLLFKGIRAESKYATPNLMVILLLAFVLRSFLAVASSLGRLVPALYTLDAEEYDRLGQLVVTGWRSGTPASHALFSSLNVKVYAYLCAAVYYALGHSPLTMKILNCFAGTLMVYNTFRITQKLHNEKTATRVALLLAVFPSLVFWTSQNFRDALVFYLISQIIYWSILWAERGGLRWPALLFLLSLPLLLLRIYIGLLTVLCIVLTGGYHLARSRGHLLKPVVYIVSLIGLVAVIYFSRSVSASAIVWDMTADKLAMLRDRLAVHGATNFASVQYDSWLDVIKSAPWLSLYFLLSPFPWQMSNPVQALASIENLLFWGFLLLSALQTGRLLRAGAARIFFMLLFIAGAVILFGLVEGNVGTGYRHKMHVIPYIMAIGCIFLSEHRARKRQVA
jgi:hypothetical protein